MRRTRRSALLLLAFACLIPAFAASGLAHATTITVVNLDGTNEGFNDPTPVNPVGGNPGTTVGMQRRNAFQFAADLWGTRVDSVVPILIGANFNPLSCSQFSGILGSAGPETVHRNFTGAPVTNTWFVQALANSLAGTDLSPTTNDIGAEFNSNVGTANCLTTASWYYGFDSNPPPGGIDFVSTVLHEIGHGLGFLDLVDLATGAKFGGFNDAYMRFLENHSTGKLYPNMTNAQRVTASKATGNLHWVGSNVIAEGSFLTDGREPISGHVEMYAPNPQRPGSSVSHFSTALDPNELMEPFDTGPNHDLELTVALFKDIGWTTLTSTCGNSVIDMGEVCDPPGQQGGCNLGEVCDATCTTCIPIPPFCGDGIINGTDTCDDGNNVGGDGCSALCQVEACFVCTGQPSTCTPDASCGLGLDHFLFYKVLTTLGTPAFVPPPPVSLVDQFEPKNFDVKRPLSLGNPANKNNEDPSAPMHPDHLQAYMIKAIIGAPPHVKQTNIRVDNQFGTLRVNTIRPDRLLVPSAKKINGPTPPPPVNPAVDHFKCYLVTITLGTPKFAPRLGVPIDDQFADTPRLFDIKKPTRLCNPVNKNNEEPGAELHPGHLMCYQVKPSLGQPKHQKVTNIHINNQFGPLRLNTTLDEELCVPSVKTP